MLSSCFVLDKLEIEGWSEKEMKHKKLKTAKMCLEILHIYLECPQTVDVSKSIIQTSITMLYEAYSHCKDSEAFYGEFFEEFTNELGSFYKNIQDVQKVTLERLDALLNSDSFNRENDISSIISVSSGIGQLCKIVTTLDQNIALIFWRVFLKLLSKYKDIVLGKLEVCEFLLPLILSIDDIVSQCIYCLRSKEQIVESDIKLCIMELSLLKKVVQIFIGYLKQNVVTPLRNLSLQLFNLLELSHSQTVAESKDLNLIKILLKTVKHAIIPVFSEHAFLKSTLHCRKKDISSDSQVPLILLKLMAINCLKSSSEYSELLQSSEVLIEIFSTLKENTPEDDYKVTCLKIPTTLFREASKETVELMTVYEHCYTCLAEYSKVFFNPSESAEMFDECLLNVFISCSDVVSLLISDVWVNFLRSGTVDDVFKCSNIIAKIIGQQTNHRLEQIFLRIIKLLPDDHKVKLFEENENLCCLLSKGSFLKGPYPVICCEKLISVIENLNVPAASDFHKRIQRICSILEFCTSFIDNLSSAELLKFVEFSSIAFKSNIFEIDMAVVSFLRAFSDKTLQKHDKEFDSLTSSIAQLLSNAMQHKNYIIRLEAFNVYFRLAESTPHPEIVKKTVMKCPTLAPDIKSYAEKIPSSGFLKEPAKHDMYQQQLTQYELNNTSKYCLSDESRKLLSDLLK